VPRRKRKSQGLFDKWIEEDRQWYRRQAKEEARKERQRLKRQKRLERQEQLRHKKQVQHAGHSYGMASRVYRPRKSRGEVEASGSDRAGWIQLIAILSAAPAFLVFLCYPNQTGMTICLVGIVSLPIVTRLLLWEFVERRTAADRAWNASFRSATELAPQTPRDLERPLELMKLSPAEFENEIAWVFERLYPVQAIRTGGAGDGGIDVKIFQNGTLKAIIQAKRHNPRRTLSPAYLREMESNKRLLEVPGIVITTAFFSADTEETNNRVWHIVLINGSEFDRMRTKARFGSIGHEPMITNAQRELSIIFTQPIS
jgi:hypothetical protein